MEIPLGPLQRPRTDRIITDDDYITWLIEKYPLLRQHESTLAAARLVFLSLAAVPDTVTAESLSQLATSELLWPTSTQLTDPQASRFFGRDPQDGTQFTFLGRSLVSDVANSRQRRIFLYGPQGVGKSHILAAVAFVLSVRFAKDEAGSMPVCYIPDMADALDVTCYFFDCLLQAFINQPLELAQLAEKQPLISPLSWIGLVCAEGWYSLPTNAMPLANHLRWGWCKLQRMLLLRNSSRVFHLTADLSLPLHPTKPRLTCFRLPWTKTRR